MATFQGLSQTQINSLTADITAAGQLAMRSMSSMTLSAMAAFQPSTGTGVVRGYNYGIRPGVLTLLSEAFDIDPQDPDTDDIDFIKRVYGAFAGRMQVTSLRFAPGTGNPNVLEFDAFADRTQPNTIFVRNAFFSKAAPDRAITLLHEYVHLRFPNNSGDGHPGGQMVMFGRGRMGIAFDDASRNPYCYEYFARFVSTV
jgi:hypothetical protein